MNKELNFLIHNQQKLHPNDYAGVLYQSIIETLLLIDWNDTIDFIESIENEDDMQVASSHFPRICGHFQSQELIDRIEKAIEKFESSEWYEYIKDALEEGKETMDEED